MIRQYVQYSMLASPLIGKNMSNYQYLCVFLISYFLSQRLVK